MYFVFYSFFNASHLSDFWTQEAFVENKYKRRHDEKTRQYYFFTARQNVLQKLRKLALQKHMKPNTTVFHSCTITANIWAENNRKLEQKELM